MRKRIYTEVLNDNYKALGYYADELVDSKSDFDFFHVIAIFLAPLIRRAPAFKWFFFRCMQDKDAYFRQRTELEDLAPIEIEQTYRDLKQDLKASNLLNNSEIERKIEKIAQIFAQKTSYGIPSYIENVHVELCHLLEDILCIGVKDLVKKYATIVCRSGQFYVDKFTFGEAIPKLREMDGIWQNPGENLWVAWEYFALVEWCWITPFSFFDDKQEQYSDYRSRNMSIHMLILHNHWARLHRIKERDYGHKDITFNRTTYIKCLKRIVNEVILHQEVSNVYNSSLKVITENDNFVPYQIQLRLFYTKLFLDIKWFEHGEIDQHLIHSFHDGKGPLT